MIGETLSTKDSLREMVSEESSMKDNWRMILYEEPSRRISGRGGRKVKEDTRWKELPSDLLRRSQYFDDILSYGCQIELILFGLES